MPLLRRSRLKAMPDKASSLFARCLRARPKTGPSSARRRKPAEAASPDSICTLAPPTLGTNCETISTQEFVGPVCGYAPGLDALGAPTTYFCDTCGTWAMPPTRRALTASI